jgi:uncharacterized membrane protein
MDAPDPNLLVIYGYKALVLLVGFACVCLGIWLAFKRVNTRVGNVNASAGKLFGIKLTQPTAAALLIIAGTVIIVYGVTRPFKYDSGGGIDSFEAAPPATNDSAPATAAPDTPAGGGTQISDTAVAPATPRVQISDTM